ncbi:MAG: hypothetical protein J0I06_24190 [Planctomycetes bacterium]|nr:hypothetical protein [Planctomycetota bacterium]
MPDLAPRPASAHSGRPFVVVLVLAIAVWASALVPRDGFTPALTTRPFSVTTGSAPGLAGAIRSAPHEIVFVGEPTATYSAAGRKKFFDPRAGPRPRLARRAVLRGRAAVRPGTGRGSEGCATSGSICWDGG